MSPRIVSHPSVMLGKPVIEGTRVTVELVLERLAGGESVADVVASYPHISEDQVRAAVAYAAALLKNEEYFPFEPAAK